MQFHIENMTCGGCARSVTKAIQSVDSAAEIKTDPETRKVDVTSDKPRDAFLPVLEEAGYPAAAA
mgnify:FL=1|tara:strand:- start:2398 stop:2592 length:195 start_codon:yes stop_codon:yes gene_type:complete